MFIMVHKRSGVLTILKLLRMLADEQIEPQVRYYIAETVGRLGEQSVIPHLWNIYNLSRWHDRWVAGKTPAA